MLIPRGSQKADLIGTRMQMRRPHLLQIATTILLVLLLTACGTRIDDWDCVFANPTGSDPLTKEQQEMIQQRGSLGSLPARKMRGNVPA